VAVSHKDVADVAQAVAVEGLGVVEAPRPDRGAASNLFEPGKPLLARVADAW